MLDLTTDKGRIISAALGLAAEKPWRDIGLAEIAARAGIALPTLRREFASKTEILGAFTRLVDDEVLRRAPLASATYGRRDALFEIVMSRFDVLEPYKGALKSITGSGLPDLGHVLPILASQRWMLEAAGIRADGLDGGVRVAGLMTVYASVFRTWLEDDDRGLARTMAALDRRLRRGEQTINSIEGICAGMRRAATAVAGVVDGVRSRGARPAAPDAGGTQPPTA